MDQRANHARGRRNFSIKGMIPILSLPELEAKIDAFDPIAYAKTRNYIDGGVSYLSPYISRGLISIKQIVDRLQNRGFSLFQVESFVMELCWREHFQRLWQQHDPTLALRREQQDVMHRQLLPLEIIHAQTGIQAIDLGIQNLYQSGYMHNHLRMYTASLVCNHYQVAWELAAPWLHYHLLDADVASNHFSWQWVCGANANKLYFANQENVNKYAKTQQKNTPIDTSYEAIAALKLSGKMSAITFDFIFPKQLEQSVVIDPNLPTYVYTPYNLDPLWHTEVQANRILFWDTTYWQQFPVSEKVQSWINELGKHNIDGLQIYYGQLADLQTQIDTTPTFCKEHPSTKSYPFQMDARSWLLPDLNEVPISFFSFWKKVQKHLQKNWKTH